MEYLSEPAIDHTSRRVVLVTALFASTFCAGLFLANWGESLALELCVASLSLIAAPAIVLFAGTRRGR
jgi:hypothetical protein